GDCFLNLCEKFFFRGVLPGGLPKKLIEMNTGISEFFSELFGKGGFATAGCAYDVDSFHHWPMMSPVGNPRPRASLFICSVTCGLAASYTSLPSVNCSHSW